MKLEIPFETIIQSGLCTKHGYEISAEILSVIIGVKVSYIKEILSNYDFYFSDKKIPSNIAYFIAEKLFSEDRAKELRHEIDNKISQFKEWLDTERKKI
jgi:hypothetical protein